VETASRRERAQGPRKGPKPVLIALAVAVVLVVAAVIATAASMRVDGNVEAASQSTASVEEVAAEDPHEICTSQLWATVKHLVNAGYGAEMRVNGTSDPFYVAAMPMMATAASDRLQIGDTAALEKLERDASEVCTTTLKDAIRPNYPTDGTYPE
jgi:hypothetical protein